MSTTTTLRALIIGDSTSAEAAMGRTAAAADAAAAEMSTKFEGAAQDVGGLFTKLGNSAEKFGIPFGSSLTKMGEKMDEAKSHGQGLQQGMNDLGAASLAVGGVALVAVGAASIDLASKFQSTVTSIAASAGIPVAAAQKIGTAFLDTAGTTIYSGQEIGKAYAGVAAQLGATQGKALDANQAMQVMKSSMDLAEGSGESLGTSTSDLANIMQVYGIKAQGAGKAANELFQAGRLSGAGMDSVSASIARMHTQLGVATPSLGETGALLIDLAEHGQVGSRAVRAVSTAMTTLLKPTEAAGVAQANLSTIMKNLPPSLQGLAEQYQKGSISSTALTSATKGMTLSQSEAWKQFTTASGAVTTANEKYKEMGLTVTNSKGQFVGIGSVIDQLHTKIHGMTEAQGLATLSQVFGAKAAGQLYATVAAGPGAFDKATAAVQKNGAAHEAAEKQAQTLSHQFELVKATAEDYGTKLGTALLPKLEGLMHATAEVVGWFMKHKAAAEVLAGVIGGVLAAAIAVYAVNTGQKMVNATKDAISSVSNLISSFGSQAAASEDLTATMDAQSAALAETQSQMKSVAESASVTSKYLDVMNSSQDALTESAATLAESNDALAASYETLDEAIATLPEGLATAGAAEEEFAVTSAEAGEASSLAFGPIGIAIMAIVTIGMLVVSHWKQISHALVEAFHYIEVAGVAVWHALESAWRAVEGVAKAIFNGVMNFFKKWGLDLLIAFAPVVGIPIFLATHWRKVEADAKAIWGDVVSFFKSIPHKILEVFSAAGSWLLHAGSDILHGLWNGLLAEASLVMSIGSKVWGWIKTGVKDIGHWLLQAGKDLINGLIHGIEDMAMAPVKAVEGAVHGVVSAAKSILGIFSPSAVFSEIGGNVMKGLAKGISENKALAAAELKALDLGKELISDMQKIGAAATRMASTVTAAASGMTRLGVAARTVESAVGPLASGIQRIGTSLTSVVTSVRTVETALTTFGARLRETAPSVQALISRLASGSAAIALFRTEVTGSEATMAKWRGTLTQSDASLNTFRARLEATASAVRTVGSAAVSAFQQVVAGITRSRAAIQSFDGAWSAAWDDAMSTLSDWWDNAQSIFQAIKEQGLDYLRTGTDTLRDEWVSDWNIIRSTLVSAWSNIQSYLVQIRTSGLDLLRTDTDTLRSQWISDWQQMQSGPSGAWGAMGSAISGINSAVTSINSNVSTLHADWDSAWSGMASDVLSAFPNPTQMLFPIGQEIMQGLVNGINSEGGAVAQATANVAAQAAQAARSQVKAHSPSLVFHEIGRSISQGMATGITADSHLVTAAMRTVTDELSRTHVTLPSLGGVNAAVAAGVTVSPSVATPQQAGVGSLASLPAVPLNIALQMDKQQVASILIPDLRALLYQRKRNLVTLEMS